MRELTLPRLAELPELSFRHLTKCGTWSSSDANVKERERLLTSGASKGAEAAPRALGAWRERSRRPRTPVAAESICRAKKSLAQPPSLSCRAQRIPGAHSCQGRPYIFPQQGSLRLSGGPGSLQGTGRGDAALGAIKFLEKTSAQLQPAHSPRIARESNTAGTRALR